MNLVYADTSALARAYLPEERGHAEMARLLLDGEDPVVTSALARVELGHAVRKANRRGVLRRWDVVLAAFDRDCGGDGPLTLLDLRSGAILLRARELVLEHQLTTLDAIHLAVALEDAADLAGEDEVIFVTRDRTQARAARTLGLTVA